MPSMGRVGRQLSSLLWRATVEQEVSAELEFHLEMTTRELMERGMARDAARAEAHRRFGDRAAVDAQCRRFGRERDRQRSRAEYLRELRDDMAFGLRQLARAPSFAVVAICTLALGIGATAAVFSALHAVVLRPLPFVDPERVVKVIPTRRGDPLGAASAAEFATVRALRGAFARVAGAISGAGFTFVTGDAPEVVGGAFVTSEYLRVFGVPPALGRDLLPSDDVPGAARVAVLSHRLWTRIFGADPRILGRGLRINEETFTVVGIMPPRFDITASSDELWVPLRLSSTDLQSNDGRFLQIVARVAPGVSLAKAGASAAAGVGALALKRSDGARDIGARVSRFADELTGDYRRRLYVLLGAVGFVLLIACVNVANLLLARGSVRQKEVAIRAALGAGRGRLVRQHLAESLVLALVGATIGVALAFMLVRALVAISPEGVPRLDQARVDGTVLAFTLGIAALTSVLVGLLPAMRSAGEAVQGTLREGGRGSAGGVRDRMRATLVGVEVALALTLLTGAGLLIRTALAVQRVDPGFAPAHVLAARLLLPAARYPDAPAIVRAYGAIQEAVARVPGVRGAALVSVVPISGSNMRAGVDPEDRPARPGERVSAELRLASAGYFATMGIPLLDGRDLQRTDDAGAPRVVVISQALAKRLWPAERAIGKRIDAVSFDPGKRNWMEVVGVVGDLRDVALVQPAGPAIYLPFAQTPPPLWPAVQRSLVVVARTTPDPNSVVRAVRQAVATVDSSLPLADVHTMEWFLATSLETARFNTLLLSALGVVALVLASIGVYGVVAYYVSQRTREIGVRLALGATAAHIWRLVLRRGLAPIVGGALAGAALSLATARLLEGQLYGVPTHDPATLAAVGLLLLLVSVLAAFVPARRAMRVAPAVALSAE